MFLRQFDELTVQAEVLIDVLYEQLIGQQSRSYCGDMRERLPALRSQMASPAASFPATRPLIFLIDAPTTDVSATEIRRWRAAGQSIAEHVPFGVHQHIVQHGLYGSIHQHNSSDTADDAAERPPAAGRLHGQD